jgi:hypothetical protein
MTDIWLTLPNQFTMKQKKSMVTLHSIDTGDIVEHVEQGLIICMYVLFVHVINSHEKREEKKSPLLVLFSMRLTT